MTKPNSNVWPEVEIPKGWKKNPRAGQRLTWFLVLTVLISTIIMVISAPTSELLPMVCFLALVLLPFSGTALTRIGFGTNYREVRELHTIVDADVKCEPNEDGSCTLVRCNRIPFQKLHFPDEMFGMPITSVHERLLRGNRIIAFVHLPAGLQAIPAAMFERCDNLPAIMIPPAVTSIGPRAFARCSELKDVYLPASVTSIAPDAFADCGNVLLHVHPGSYAETFAREHHFISANK